MFQGELPISVDGPATLRTLEHVTSRGILVQCELHAYLRTGNSKKDTKAVSAITTPLTFSIVHGKEMRQNYSSDKPIITYGSLPLRLLE